MEFVPEDTTVEKLLNEKIVFKIPRYQRNYVWNESNIIQLIDDIQLKTSDESRHFLGSIILIKSNGKEYHEIIDGQQRITTLELCIMSLILIHREHLLINPDDKPLKNDIKYLQDFIYTRKQKGNFEQKLLINDELYKRLCESLLDDDFGSVDDIMNIINLKTKDKYIEAFKIIYNKLVDISNSSSDALETFEEKFFNTRVIKITSNNENEAYEIFEILNARGVQLKQIELLKNYVFRFLSNGKTYDNNKKRWEEMDETLEDIKTDDFLHHFVRSYYGLYTKKLEDYKCIKEHEDKDTIKTFFDNILKYSNVYRKICKVETSETDEYLIYNYLRIKKVAILKPVLSSLRIKLNNKILSSNDYKESLSVLLKFIVGYNIIGVMSNKIDNSVTNLAHDIYTARYSKEILSYVYSFVLNHEKLYPSESEFKNKLNEIRYSNKDTRSSVRSSYILFLFQPLYGIKNIFDGNYNIEHLICDDENNDQTWKIGNLIPLEKKLNTKVKNKPIKEKIELFNVSGCDYVVSNFCSKYSNFDCAEIDKRQEKIVDKILECYLLDFELIKCYKEKSQFILSNYDNIDKNIKDILEKAPIYKCDEIYAVNDKTS